MSVRNIEDDDDFMPLIKKEINRTIFLKFSATWCGPCKRIQPLYNLLAQQNPHCVFCHLDVDECPEVAEKNGIKSLPTFLCVRGGQCVGKMIGAKRENLVAFVKKYTGKNEEKKEN